ncbi:MAG: TolC family protein [Deinococcales bacterium]|jgi:outer membrane protein
MRMLTVFLLLLTGAVSAQIAPSSAPLTLERALALGPEASATVLSARAALEAAQRTEARVAADPASLRVDRVSAETARADAERSLAAALAANRVSVAGAVFDALEADTAVDVATLDAAIREQTLQAERARLQAGAATDLDVAKAENAYRTAEATLTDATTQRTLAHNTLASLIGREVASVSPVVEVPALQDLDSYRQQADQTNAGLLAARGAERLAEAQLQAADNDFSSRSQIQDARDAHADAQRHVGEVARTLDLAVRGAHANAEAAAAAYRNAEAADTTAERDLAAARARLDAGSISPLAFRSSELTRAQAAQSLQSARHALILRIYTLEQVVAGG